ncbi:MAG: isochorismatase family protein [Chthonomonadales bacterium]
MSIPLEMLQSEGIAFLELLEEWKSGLTPLPLETYVREAGGAEHVGIFCVDVINGFCTEGPLQSDRIQAIVKPIRDLMLRAWDVGVRAFVLPQDSHPPSSPEFNDYPPHCITGTSECQTVPELLSLPFASQFVIIPKKSISSAVRTDLPDWVDRHREITHRIVVGDCTDLCTYQLALYLKTEATARDEGCSVIVPADCVATYDIPVASARDAGIPAHPGDLFHALFLYHMALNGVRVISAFT